MKNDKFIKKIIWNAIVVSLLMIIVIAVINKIPNSFAPHNNDWIPFYGSFVGAIISGIIAGLLTFEGVKKTIDYSEETRKEDFRKSIMPFFQVKVLGFGGSKEKNHFELCNVGENTNLYKNNILRIQFKNIGMKHAINVRYDSKLLANAIGVDEESEKISFDIKVNNADEIVNNCYKFLIDFQDISGDLYIQEYEIKFEGDIEMGKLSALNTFPKIQ